jgi:hypothetical protein
MRIIDSSWHQQPMSDEAREHLHGVEAALERAYKSACAIAKQFNTPIVTEQNGQLVKLAVN